MAITVLVVDDSAFMRQLIKQMLESDQGIQVVGVATDGLDALKKVAFFQPQVITLDLEMPRMDGIQFLTELMQNTPLPVVIVSSLAVEGGEQTFKALELGAIDFITKPVSKPSKDLWRIQDELIQKVKAAAQVRPELITKLPPPSLIEEPSFFEEYTTGIVAIGASTGGPRALQYLLTNLPSDFPWGIIIAQHMPKEFVDSFALRLNSLSPLTVKVAEGGEEVLPGEVLVAPPGLQTGVVRRGKQYQIKLEKSDALYRPSIDYLFTSVANTFKEQSVGVLLTGMGADGAYGLRLIKEAGGFTIAESEETCVIYGMPRAAMDIEAVLYQLPLTKIPNQISLLLKNN